MSLGLFVFLACLIPVYYIGAYAFSFYVEKRVLKKRSEGWRPYEKE
jgi:hypothetical protein